jgi:CRP/FNR family transcriptional regulator, cyclic AMP receptor protein
MAAMTDSVKLKANEYLVREGEESSQMYYLQSGTLGVFKIKGNIEQQIGTIYSGEVVGEMSFLDKEPRSASVKALVESTLTAIPSDKFERALASMPAWHKALVHTLLDRLRKANSRIRV